eukprot:gene37937-61341_t
MGSGWRHCLAGAPAAGPRPRLPVWARSRGDSLAAWPGGAFAPGRGRRAERIAPLRAMLLALVTRATSEPITIWYGARADSDAPYALEFARLAAQHAHVEANLVLAASGNAMTLHEAARQSLMQRDDLHDCEFYVCGAPIMLQQTLQMLAGLGVAPGKVVFEDFK